MTARERSCDPPHSCDAQEREQPERCQLRLIRVREADEPGAGIVDPHADRDQVEDADDLVGGRMRRALLVPVVQTIELGGDNPRRKQEHEDDRLLADSDAAGDLVPQEEQFGREERS